MERKGNENEGEKGNRRGELGRCWRRKC